MNTTAERIEANVDGDGPLVIDPPLELPPEPEPAAEAIEQPLPAITISSKGGSFEAAKGDWAYTDIGIFAQGHWRHEQDAPQRDIEFTFENIAYIEYHGLGGE
jgi:hypothetical protein